MEKKPAPETKPVEDTTRDENAKRKLARPTRDKTEVTIGPTDRTGPDVLIR